MKRLVILRHAKSSWDDASLADFDRPLNRRGERDAPRIGAWMAARGLRPDRIVSSPALRASRTARLVAETLGFPPEEIRFEPRIYDATPGTLLEVVRGLDDGRREILLVGHNPGLQELVNALGDTLLAAFPTCALAVLEFSTETWQAVAPGQGVILELITPKKLKSSPSNLPKP